MNKNLKKNRVGHKAGSKAPLQALESNNCSNCFPVNVLSSVIKHLHDQPTESITLRQKHLPSAEMDFTMSSFGFQCADSSPVGSCLLGSHGAWCRTLPSSCHPAGHFTFSGHHWLASTTGDLPLAFVLQPGLLVESSLHMMTAEDIFTADVGILPIPSAALLQQVRVAMRRGPRWTLFQCRAEILWGYSCALDANPRWNIGCCFSLCLVTNSIWKGGIKQLSLPVLVKSYLEQASSKHLFFCR